MYDYGEGVPEDYAKALHWYRKVAEQGDVEAQYNLGLMYGNGGGVPQDNVHAYTWWGVAVTQGNENAKKSKEIVEERMTHEQIAKGQELAAEYWEKYVVPFQED
jgi:TPR repeat protein